MVHFRRLFQLPDVRRYVAQRIASNADAAHYRTLRAIDDLDGEPGVSTIAELLDLDISTVSRMLEKAIAAGLVASARSDADGRRRILALTPAGRWVLDEVSRVRMELWAELAHGVDAADLATAADVFDRLHANAARLGRD